MRVYILGTLRRVESVVQPALHVGGKNEKEYEGESGSIVGSGHGFGSC